MNDSVVVAPAPLGELRRIQPEDNDALRHHLLRLSAEERRMRFCAHVSDARVRRYGFRQGSYDVVSIGCFVDDVLRGAGELALRGPRVPGVVAELAVSVESGAQGHGIAAELMRRLLISARRRNVGTVAMWFLYGNAGARALAERFGARLLFDVREIEAAIWPAWPTQLSLMEEALADGCALFSLD